jgi:outer membrane protein OmpA-like peptidoglycan-associated protein
MSTEWHDINNPGAFKRKDQEQSAKPASAEDSSAQSSAPEQKVILRNGTFSPGADGYAFAKKVKVGVEATLDGGSAGDSISGLVTFGLFSKHKNVEQDHKHSVDSGVHDGKAEGELTLYYDDGYYDAGMPQDEKVEYYFKASHAKAQQPLTSETLEMPQSTRIAVDFIEIADVHFHHNCALPCLDEKGELIAALVSAFSYAKDHSDRELVVQGHADRSGDASYNQQISKRRAEAIKSLLDNDADMWKGVVSSDGTDQKLETEDYQQTLKSLAVKYGRPCDPGAIDNKKGPKTQSAVKGFQGEYNSRFPSNEQLTVDGSVGPKTWQAIFHTLRNLLDEGLKAAKLDPPPSLTYGYPDGDGIYPCGESSPVSDAEKSEEDRRVELVFYAKNDWSPAIPPSPGKKVDTKKDPVSEKDWKKTPVVIGLPTGGAVTLKVVRPEKTPHKQFINLTQNDADQGPELKMKVEATGCADGTVVSWIATVGDANSKRNDPLAGLKSPDTGKVVGFADKKSTVDTSVKNGSAECTLVCGLAGGDTYTVEVKCSGQSAKVTIESWRRLWYQRTYHKDAAVPAMTTPEKQLKGVFIEFMAEPDVKHVEGTAGQVIIGRHNASSFHALLNTTHTGQCVNVIFCDRQFDGIDTKGNNYVSRKTSRLTSQSGTVTVGDDVDANLAIFNPPLQKGAAFLIKGTWANVKGKTDGTLTDDPAKVNDSTGLVTRIDELDVKVDLPKNAAASAGSPVDVALEITAASGPWGGDGGTAPHNLIVINKNDTIHSMCIMHELGHLMNMVPLTGYYKCPPGFVYEDHKYRYEKMGGSGSHCSFGNDKAKSTAKRYVDGTCIMFHQLTLKCKLEFCECCAPFVKAQALQKFHDLK